MGWEIGEGGATVALMQMGGYRSRGTVCKDEKGRQNDTGFTGRIRSHHREPQDLDMTVPIVWAPDSLLEVVLLQAFQKVFPLSPSHTHYSCVRRDASSWEPGRKETLPLRAHCEAGKSGA